MVFVFFHIDFAFVIYTEDQYLNLYSVDRRKYSNPPLGRVEEVEGEGILYPELVRVIDSSLVIDL